MVGALECFTYLADNAPSWIKSLEELELRIQKSQTEVAKVAVPVAQKIKKSSSNESIRNSPVDTSSPSTGLEITSAPQPRHVQQSAMPDYAIHPTPSRKRKTTSLISAASRLHKYRSRSTVIVYYDSEVQTAFDRLVRNISAGRSNIRKSRMADRVGVFTAMDNQQGGSRNAWRPYSTMQNGTEAPSFDAYITSRLSKPGGLRPTPRRNDELTDAREKADQALDKAQNFCEQGAHQFLRDGDCIEEIIGAKSAFEKVLKISQEEVEKLTKLAAEQEETNKVQHERNPQVRQNEFERTQSIGQHPALLHSHGLIEADDDDDEEDEEYDDPSKLPSPQFRLMART